MKKLSLAFLAAAAFGVVARCDDAPAATPAPADTPAAPAGDTPAAPAGGDAPAAPAAGATGIQAAIGTVGQLLPELSQVFDMLKTTTTTKMGDISHPEGFSQLNMGMDHGQGACKKDKLPQLFDLWMEDVARSPESMQNIKNFIQLYMIQDVYDPLEKTAFQFSFDDGHGTMMFIRMVLEPHPTVADVVRWEKLSWYSDFKPAKPFAIVTKSKCNILHCSTKDSIVYMEATIDDAHISQIANMGIKFLHLFDNAGTNVLNAQSPPAAAGQLFLF
jgi:hypothetical protein